MGPNDIPNLSLVREFLARAHSPDSANRIYSEKIQHRPLFLKPTSPPPSNARDARRKARIECRKRLKALKSKPLSARQRRKRGLYDVPKKDLKYAIFEPMNTLWLGYIREVLGNELHTGGLGAAAKLSAADFHGAKVTVSRSRCTSHVGIQGIVIKDTRYVFEVITAKNKIKTVPKEGCVFRVSVPPAPEANVAASAEDQKLFTFEIHGDQFQYRSPDRANKKFKQHFLENL
ncbi:RNase P/MRP, p29 subunit [Daldinia sp. FL1419]|nr:RNase P/MRP, p29 subunit [Daldinia sp. FL1419]